MRVNVNMNDDLLTRVDAEAKRLNISRSAFISICCSSDLNVYYREFNEEKAIEKHIDKVQEQESLVKGYLIAEQIKKDNKS